MDETEMTPKKGRYKRDAQTKNPSTPTRPASATESSPFKTPVKPIAKSSVTPAPRAAPVTASSVSSSITVGNRTLESAFEASFVKLEHSDSSPSKSTPKTRRTMPGQQKTPRPEKRHLIRWNDELDKRLLLTIQSECNAHGITLPWDAIGRGLQVEGGVSGGAIIQHLAKTRIRMNELGLAVPAPLKRGGGTRISAGSNASTPRRTPKTSSNSQPGRKSRAKSSKAEHKEISDDSSDGEDDSDPDGAYGEKAKRSKGTGKRRTQIKVEDDSSDEVESPGKSGEKRKRTESVDEDCDDRIAKGAPFLSMVSPARAIKGQVGLKTVPKPVSKPEESKIHVIKGIVVHGRTAKLAASNTKYVDLGSGPSDADATFSEVSDSDEGQDDFRCKTEDHKEISQEQDDDIKAEDVGSYVGPFGVADSGNVAEACTDLVPINTTYAYQADSVPHGEFDIKPANGFHDSSDSNNSVSFAQGNEDFDEPQFNRTAFNHMYTAGGNHAFDYGIMPPNQVFSAFQGYPIIGQNHQQNIENHSHMFGSGIQDFDHNARMGGITHHNGLPNWQAPPLQASSYTPQHRSVASPHVMTSLTAASNSTSSTSLPTPAGDTESPMNYSVDDDRKYPWSYFDGDF